MITPLLVTCALGFGSATAITPDTFITAAHVFANDTCEVAGRAVEIVYQDAAQDILIGRVRRPFENPSPVSCNALVTGQEYRLLGARDRSRATATATYYDVNTETAVTRDMRGMTGRAKPGMSGGAVVDESGAVIAIISAQAANGAVTVREFATTQLCEGM